MEGKPTVQFVNRQFVNRQWKTRPQTRAAFIVVFTFAFCLGFGCAQKQPSTAQSSNNGDRQSAENDKKTNTIAPNVGNGERSPAQTSEVELKIDTPPDVICQMFLKAIQKQDRHEYEKLLTRVSKRNILAANLDLQLPGSEQATCRVVDTTYNSHKKDIAMVKCIVDDIIDGKTESFEFSWLLRKQNVGWRIAGMWISTGVGKETDYLSFENTEDVSKINGMANGAAASVASEPGPAQLK